MNRETKIGLLVGLAFILVIGILLSDHVTRSTQPPEAALTNVTDDVMRGVNTPVEPSQPAIIPAPDRTRQPVPTRQDLQQPPAVVHDPGPVQLEPQAGVGLEPGPMLAAKNDPFANVPVEADLPPGAHEPGYIDSAIEAARVMHEALARAAAHHGEELQVVDAAGRRLPVERQQLRHGPIVVEREIDRAAVEREPTNRSLAVREYTAEPGDNLTRMAKKVFGESTPETRNRLRELNPELNANPNLVVVGKAYKVPADARAPEARRPLRDVPAVQQPAARALPRTYTVKPGDSLWIIARDQVGDVGAIDAIKELNRDSLGGGETIQPGMTLKLPK